MPIVALFGDPLRESGDERSGESAFREKIAQHIRRAETRSGTRPCLAAPKREANTTSRSSPRTRLHKIAIPTTPVARVLTRRFSDIRDNGTGELAESVKLKKCTSAWPEARGKTLIEKRGDDQNQRHANKRADAIKLI